jgi:hypothetical protein
MLFISPMDFVRKYEEIVRVFTICTLLVSNFTKHIHEVLLSPPTYTVRYIYTLLTLQSQSYSHTLCLLKHTGSGNTNRSLSI